MPNDNLRNIKTGTVVSVDDPTYSGRIKVRIKGLNDNIETENLPWVSFGGSSVFSGDGGGSISIPKVGTKVRLKFKKNDAASMEWVGTNRIDRNLAAELAQDYEGSHSILYDSDSDLSIIYMNSTGLRLYYKGSFIQLSPDNNITLHYGEGNQGVQIQLSDGKIDIQANTQINITSDNTVRLEGKSIIQNGSQNVQIKGNKPGECAVNGKELMKLLMNLGRMIDQKVPATAGVASSLVAASRSSILNENIQYI
jgi:hypothetical protein